MTEATSLTQRNDDWVFAHAEHCVREGASLEWAESIFAVGDEICQTVEIRRAVDGHLLRRLRLTLARGDIQSGRFKLCGDPVDLPVDCVATPVSARPMPRFRNPIHPDRS